MSPSGGNNMDPTTALIMAILGGFAGGQGTPSSQSGHTTSGSNTQSENNSNTASSSSSQLQNLVNFLQSMSSSGSTATSSTTTPNLNPAAQGLVSNLINKYSNLTAPSLTGYAAGQTSNINRNSDMQSQAVNNIMASRGLSSSPVAGTAQIGIDQNRINQITGMQQQLPLLKQQQDLTNLSAATSGASMLPGMFGSTNTGTGNTNQTQSQSGSQSQEQTQKMWQNVFNYMSNNSSTNSDQYSSQKGSQGGGAGSSVAGGLSTFLAAMAMFSDENLKKDIRPIDKAIEKVRALNPRTWKWKGGETADAGIIAQEVEKILPNLVHEDKSTGMLLKKVNYAGLIPYLIGAVQNIDKRVEALS